MTEPRAFVFNTERRLVLLTGRKAATLPQLVEHLRTVSGASIFYHTHHQFLSKHFERPLFHDDFSQWVARALLEERLAEELAAIDLLACTSVRQIREAIMAVIEAHLDGSKRAARAAQPDDEFRFCEAQSFLMPTGVVANGVDEFFQKVGEISNASLFYHFFEARLRLERATNDFSLWLRDAGEERAAREIDRRDPYTMTLDELREEIVHLGETR